MRKSLYVAVALGALTAVAATVAAAFVWVAARGDVVARGITAGGVHIGGLTAADARTRLERELGARLEQPVVARHGTEFFTVSPSDVRARIDVAPMVREALRRSEGNFLVRAARDLVGGRIEAKIPVTVSYSEPALSRAVRRIADPIERRPRNAKVALKRARLVVVRGKNGLSVRTEELRRGMAAAVTDLRDDNLVTVRTAVRVPRVTVRTIATRYPKVIVVSRRERKLRFYERLKLVKTYVIAVGQAGLETPAGLYKIQNKAVNPAWHVPDSAWAGELAGKIIAPDDPANPIEARWMGIYDGAGIHGTADIASLGTAASHGCIRMAIPDVVELYDRVKVNTPVYIA